MWTSKDVDHRAWGQQRARRPAGGAISQAVKWPWAPPALAADHWGARRRWEGSDTESPLLAPLATPPLVSSLTHAHALTHAPWPAVAETSPGEATPEAQAAVVAGSQDFSSPIPQGRKVLHRKGLLRPARKFCQVGLQGVVAQA